ncbi:MAG: glycosyltransferase family 2 protein [Gemmataceae bacterium]|nr:glycosyltransferase family 2 protein [Gemmata sp.]MDW8197748.1 glycosyltransferase family 2 protein [Gemmataceae bacterium]
MPRGAGVVIDQATPAESTSRHPRDTTPPPGIRAPSTDGSTLAVVIVNFCQWNNTARLVEQLRQSAAIATETAHIQIVDNGSPFHPWATRLAEQHGVSVGRLESNHGFAAAVNYACRRSRATWLLLLNPDITVPPRFLDDVQNLIVQTEPSPRVGIIGLALRNRDGSPQPSTGVFPTLGGTLTGLFRPRQRRKCRPYPGHERGEVDWATGGCLLIRRRCFEQLAGLDEAFFLYYEDVDFCHRATQAGWEVWFEPRLSVTHHWPLHARPVPAPLRLITRHALLTYAQRYWPRWQTYLLAGLIGIEAASRQLAAAVLGQNLPARIYRELRRLVVDVVAGRTTQQVKRLRYAAGFLQSIAAEQDDRFDQRPVLDAPDCYQNGE